MYEPIYNWVSRFRKSKAGQKVRANLNCQYATKFIIGLLESSAEQMYLFTETDTEEVLIQKRGEAISSLRTWHRDTLT
ncbi:hypothetical protein ACEQPO_06315 [Bacillus sp. SL00103]